MRTSLDSMSYRGSLLLFYFVKILFLSYLHEIKDIFRRKFLLQRILVQLKESSPYSLGYCYKKKFEIVAKDL